MYESGKIVGHCYAKGGRALLGEGEGLSAPREGLVEIAEDTQGEGGAG